MTRALAVGAAVINISAGVLSAPQTVFRASADLVAVDVAVTDRLTPVASLAPSDFVLTDNGVSQTIAGMSYGTVPIDVRLFVDMSGSITTDQLARHERAMRQLQAALTADDRCEISTFARRVNQDLTLRTPPIAVSLRRPDLDGTSFYDAALLSMITTARPGRRLLTMLLTDGVDSTSFFDEGALSDAAKRTDAVVYVLTAVDGKIPVVLQQRLQRMTKPTGGQLITIARGADVGAALEASIAEFRQAYVLTYTPSNVQRTGWHAIKVSVPKQKSYTIRARQGYFGG
jgi:VWFA-related protein